MESPRFRHVPVRDGTRLHAVDWATDETAGIPIILIHGLASNARLWDGAARALSAHGHRVIAIDLRGHGRSDKPHNGYDMSSVALDVVDVINHLEHEHSMWHRPLIVGQSWGGNVVVEVAAHHHELIRGAVCVDGGAIELQHLFPEWERCREMLSPPQLEGMPAQRLEQAIRATHPDWSDEAIAGAMANMELLPDGTIRPWLTRERHIAILKSLWEHVPSHLYPNISCPVMFTPASRDDDPMKNMKHITLAKAQESLNQAQIIWFEPADHDLHAQFPQRFADTVQNAINEGFFV